MWRQSQGAVGLTEAEFWFPTWFSKELVTDKEERTLCDERSNPRIRWSGICRPVSCGISRHIKWFKLGALEEALSSWLWVINRSLRPSVLFWKALESFTEQIFMAHPVCCRLGHSTVSPGETLSPMLDPWKCLLTPKLFESVVGEKPSM